MEDERQQEAALKAERAQLAALGGGAPTRTQPQTVQGLKGQLADELKRSLALRVDKNAPRPSDALSDID
jgi:Tfp pilus assembly PilM family ATPase